MERINLGEVEIRHGETKTLTTIIDKPFRVVSLVPEPGAYFSCMTTLGVPPQCAVYEDVRVEWNVDEGEIISKKELLPFTVKVSITCYFYKGEWHGAEAGEPALTIHKYFYPYIIVEYLVEEIPPPPITPPELPPPSPPIIPPPPTPPEEVTPPPPPEEEITLPPPQERKPEPEGLIALALMGAAFLGISRIKKK